MRIILFLLLWVSSYTHASFNDYAPVIVQAAEYVGVDPVLMLAIAHKETRFRNVAARKGGSAEGLMQITDRTWKHLLSRYANKYTVAMDADKYDPWSNSVMAAAYVRENTEILFKVLGRNPTNGEIYMAHLLGARGASDLLRANLNKRSDDVVPYAIKRNGPLFVTSDGSYRTVRQFRDYMNWRVNQLIERYSEVVMVRSESGVCKYDDVTFNENSFAGHPKAQEIIQHVLAAGRGVLQIIGPGFIHLSVIDSGVVIADRAAEILTAAGVEEACRYAVIRPKES